MHYAEVCYCIHVYINLSVEKHMPVHICKHIYIFI